MNERTNLKEVTESIKKLLEEAIYRNDFQTFDETLAVVASHSTITDTNNQVEFERFLLDLVAYIERSTELNWFEKSGFFSVLLKNLKSCSEEALAIAKIYMVDHLVAPEHNCSTLQKEELDDYLLENSYDFLFERADNLKLLYISIHGFNEKFTNPLIRPIDIDFYFRHMFILDPNYAASEWDDLAQIYKNTSELNDNDKLYYKLIFQDIPSELKSCLNDDNYIKLVINYPELCKATAEQNPEHIPYIINQSLRKKLADDEDLGDYLEMIFADKFDRDKFNTYFKDYETNDALHREVYQPNLCTVIQFPPLDDEILASMGLNVTLDEFYYRYIEQLSTEDPSITIRVDIDDYLDFIASGNYISEDEDDDFDEDDDDEVEEEDDDDDDDFALDDYDDIWSKNDFRHGNYNSIGRGDYWDSNGIHWDENDNILD